MTTTAEPRTRTDLRPPDLGYTQWLTADHVAHRWLGGGATACFVPTVGVAGGDAVPTDAVRRLAQVRVVTWCTNPRCWGTGRCRVCGAPSGGHDECADCLTDSIGHDKALERADG